MSVLSVVLIVKIAVTLIFVILPFLTQPLSVNADRYGVTAKSALIFELYCAALIALLVNYSFGFYDTLNSVYPRTVVIVGVVSNIGASIALFKARGKTKHSIPDNANWIAISTFLTIGVLFATSLVWQSTFMHPLY